MAYLITLVHGTFAQKAPWVQPGSNFCEEIRTRLFPESVEFKVHEWSGTNSHKVRIDEGNILAEKLLLQIVDFPQTRKVIIAHSHGGNIALYALKQLKADNFKFPLITMATPFLNSTKRNYASVLKLHILLIPLLALLLLIIGAILFIIFFLSNYVNRIGVDKDSKSLIWIGLTAIIIIMAGMAAEYLSGKINKWVRKRLHGFPKKVNQEFRKLELHKNYFHNQILAVINHNDEIRFWLSSWTRIGEIIFTGYNLISRIFKPIIIIVAVNFFIVSIILMFPGKHNDVYTTFLYESELYLLIFLCSLVFLVPIITITLRFIFIFLKSNPLVLGWEPWIHQMFIKTVPASTPFEFTNVKFIEYNIRETRFFTLKHSIYNDARVVRDLCFWIQHEMLDV